MTIGSLDPAQTQSPFSRILVTGAAGYLGRTLVRRLLREGHTLRVVVRSAGDAAKLAAAGIRPDRRVEIVHHDLTRRFALPRVLEGCEAIIHAAGRMASGRGERRSLAADNVEAAAYLLEAALKVKARRVLYVSHVFGVGAARDAHPADEHVRFDLNALPGDVIQAKRIAELEALRAATRGLPIVFPTPTFCLGPGPLGRSARWWLPTLMHPLGGLWAGGINIIDVRDAARSIARLLFVGAPGERFLLGGHNLPFTALRRALLERRAERPHVRRPRPSPDRRLRTAAGALAGRILERLPGEKITDPAVAAFLSRFWYYDDTHARRCIGHRSRPLDETLDAMKDDPTFPFFRGRDAS